MIRLIKISVLPCIKKVYCKRRSFNKYTYLNSYSVYFIIYAKVLKNNFYKKNKTYRTLHIEDMTIVHIIFLGYISKMSQIFCILTCTIYILYFMFTNGVLQIINVKRNPKKSLIRKYLIGSIKEFIHGSCN